MVVTGGDTKCMMTVDKDKKMVQPKEWTCYRREADALEAGEGKSARRRQK